MRLRPSPEWEPIFEALGRLKQGWPARGFSWDNRIMCVTSSFTGEYSNTAHAAMGLALPLEYNHKTISAAHPSVRDIAEKSGGIRSNQRIFASHKEPSAGILLFGLWWPWNDQETVSARIGLAGLDANDEPYPRFRDLFKVSVE